VRDVIQNLQQDPDYYAKRTISYKLKATDPLYAMVCEYRNTGRRRECERRAWSA